MLVNFYGKPYIRSTLDFSLINVSLIYFPFHMREKKVQSFIESREKILLSTKTSTNITLFLRVTILHSFCYLLLSTIMIT